jgi:hypothetical protein
MLRVLVLRASALTSREAVIQLCGSQRVNRIDPHLALGGDFASHLGEHSEKEAPLSWTSP